MNEQLLIDLLIKMIGGTFGIIAILCVGIFVWMRTKIEDAATKVELSALHTNFKTQIDQHRDERLARDNVVDDMLLAINANVTRTHERIDDILKHR